MQPSEIEALIAAAGEAFGTATILVNNAAIQPVAAFEEISAADLSSMLATNLQGPFRLMQLFAGRVIAAGIRDASIVNIASNAGKVGYPNMAAYNASKFGMLALSDAAMLDLRHYGIRVAAILPGSVETDFNLPAGGRQKTPWKLQPKDVARAVVDLDTIRSGAARPASYFAILGFVTKCAASFGGLSLPILAFIGYSTAPGITNGPTELFWLGMLYGVVPTVVYVVAFYLCVTWPLDDRMHAKVVRILGKRYQRQVQDG